MNRETLIRLARLGTLGGIVPLPPSLRRLLFPAEPPGVELVVRIDLEPVRRAFDQLGQVVTDAATSFANLARSLSVDLGHRRDRTPSAIRAAWWRHLRTTFGDRRPGAPSRQQIETTFVPRLFGPQRLGRARSGRLFRRRC